MAIDLSRYAELVKDAQTVRVRGRVTELTGLIIRAAVPGVRVGEVVYIQGRGRNARAVRAEVVGYRGSAPLLNDLLGGQVPVAFDTFDTLLPQHEAGKIRILAVSSAKRSALAPHHEEERFEREHRHRDRDGPDHQLQQSRRGHILLPEYTFDQRFAADKDDDQHHHADCPGEKGSASGQSPWRDACRIKPHDLGIEAAA